MISFHFFTGAHDVYQKSSAVKKRILIKKVLLVASEVGELLLEYETNFLKETWKKDRKWVKKVLFYVPVEFWNESHWEFVYIFEIVVFWRILLIVPWFVYFFNKSWVTFWNFTCLKNCAIFSGFLGCLGNSALSKIADYRSNIANWAFFQTNRDIKTQRTLLKKIKRQNHLGSL